jgi:hypothetical protein
VRCRELDIFKIRNFLRNCLEIFCIFSGFFGGIFRIFLGFFLEELFWRFFWEDFFGRVLLGGFFWEDFLGGFFWEDFFGRIFWEEFLFILLKSANLFESERD